MYFNKYTILLNFINYRQPRTVSIILTVGIISSITLLVYFKPYFVAFTSLKLFGRFRINCLLALITVS